MLTIFKNKISWKYFDGLSSHKVGLLSQTKFVLYRERLN